MKNSGLDQLEMKLPSRDCRSQRRYRRSGRAQWWFSHMRAVVNCAPEHLPADELAGKPVSRVPRVGPPRELKVA